MKQWSRIMVSSRPFVRKVDHGKKVSIGDLWRGELVRDLSPRSDSWTNYRRPGSPVDPHARQLIDVPVSARFDPSPDRRVRGCSRTDGGFAISSGPPAND